MKYYVVIKIDGKGDQEVHKATCNFLPLIHNREYLGEFNSPQFALDVAKSKGFFAANGCYWCNHSLWINRSNN